MNVEMVEFHIADLAHFEYGRQEIPIVLNGCSKLYKATVMFKGSKGLACVFTHCFRQRRLQLVPSILPVKILNVQSYIHGYEQLQKLTTKPHGMFIHLRHRVVQLTVFSRV